VARAGRGGEGGTRTLDCGDGDMTFDLDSPQEQLADASDPLGGTHDGLELELDERAVRPPSPTSPSRRGPGGSAASPGEAMRPPPGRSSGAGKVIATVVLLAVLTGGGFAAWHFGLFDRWTGQQRAEPQAHSATPTPVPSAAAAETATLAVVSVPKGATVTVGERTYGTTPVSIEDLEPGVRPVVVTLEGYHPWRREVELRAGDLQSVTAQLEKAPDAEAGTGRLTLETEPPAEVLIGDEPIGHTPLDRQEVPAGVLRLTFELPSGQRVKRAVFVPKDRETRTAIVF